jgi:hypothetical protein
MDCITVFLFSVVRFVLEHLIRLFVLVLIVISRTEMDFRPGFVPKRRQIFRIRSVWRKNWCTLWGQCSRPRKISPPLRDLSGHDAPEEMVTASRHQSERIAVEESFREWRSHNCAGINAHACRVSGMIESFFTRSPSSSRSSNSIQQCELFARALLISGISTNSPTEIAQPPNSGRTGTSHPLPLTLRLSKEYDLKQRVICECRQNGSL